MGITPEPASEIDGDDVPRPQASLVIPVHNEASQIYGNTLRLREFLKTRLEDFEIIIVENGSSDDTYQIARGIADRFDDVILRELPDPCLGGALTLGFEEASGDKIVYYPIDLSVDLEFIPRSLELLEEYDIVVGSKRLRDGLDGRPLARRWASRGYHGLVRGLFATGLSDTTCVKAYRREVALGLAERVPAGSRVFETEMLVEAQRRGLRIKELPVRVVETRDSRQPLIVKVHAKLEDLLSVRLDLISLIVGVPVFSLGVLSLLYLSARKLMSAQGGFTNPYSFLVSMLLVISGFQIVTFGLLANLILQIRREVGGISGNLKDGAAEDDQKHHGSTVDED